MFAVGSAWAESEKLTTSSTSAASVCQVMQRRPLRARDGTVTFYGNFANDHERPGLFRAAHMRITSRPEAYGNVGRAGYRKTLIRPQRCDRAYRDVSGPLSATC